MRPAGVGGQADPILDPENPWPGLGAFSEHSTRFFHGRDTEAAELIRRVKRDSLTVLFGQSGLGKTSLLQAGLFPMLRTEDYLPVYVRRLFAESTLPLEEQIWQQLEAECEAHNVEAPARGTASSLWEYLHLAETAFWSERNRPVMPVIVLDQFEDLFTIGRERLDERSRAEFIASLGDLAANRVPPSLLARLNQHPDETARFDLLREPCRFVLSIREDYLPELDSERFQRTLAASTQNRMRIEPMRSAQALDAVLKTGGKLVDEQTAKEIVAFLAGIESNTPGAKPPATDAEIEPAILSVFCSGLNRKRQLLGRETIGPDLVQGSKHEILRDFYEDALADLDLGVRTFIEEKLVTESGFRNSRPLEEALREPGVTSEALDKLVNRRVVRREERFHAMQVELTHDKLTQVASESRKRRRDAERLRATHKRTRRLVVAAVVMLALTVGAIIFGVEERNLHRQLNNAAFLLATDYEVGRNTLPQNLDTALVYYQRSCSIGSDEGCKNAAKVTSLLKIALRAEAAQFESGDYGLCELDSMRPRVTDAEMSIVVPPAASRNVPFTIKGSGLSFVGGGELHGAIGVYDWLFPDLSKGFGKTLVVLAPDGSFYGHVLPFKKGTLKEWWFHARKNATSC